MNRNNSNANIWIQLISVNWINSTQSQIYLLSFQKNCPHTFKLFFVYLQYDKIFDVDESFRISFSLFVAKMNFKTFLGRKNTMKVRQLKAFFQHEGFSQDAMWWPSLRSANLIKSLRAFLKYSSQTWFV